MRVHASGQHGGKFVGNQCSDLLNNLAKLEVILFDFKVLEQCQEVLELFCSFKEVKDKYFGMKVESDWKKCIKSFCSKVSCWSVFHSENAHFR